MVTIRVDMGEDHTDWKKTAKAVPELRWLRWLVTGLTLVMGLGMVAVVALLWWRLGAEKLPQLPENITLPAGAQVQAVTFSSDWTVVVTRQGLVLLYDRRGNLRSQTRPTAP